MNSLSLQVDPLYVPKYPPHTHPYSMSTTNQKKESESFKYFFPNVSFIASILVGISTTAAISLPSQQTFFGRDDAEMLAQVQQSANLFAWAVCANGASLMLSLLMQLLYTSPNFHELTISGDYKRTARWIVGSVGWISLLLAASGMALVAEGLKVVQRQAASTLQWLLFGFSFPVLLFWVVLRVVQTINKRRGIAATRSEASEERPI